MEYFRGHCSLRGLKKEKHIKSSGGNMNREIKMTDSEIYKSGLYRAIRIAIVFSFISGIWIATSYTFFMEGRIFPGILSVTASIIAFFLSLFIGHHKLFPQEEYENGISEHDD